MKTSVRTGIKNLILISKYIQYHFTSIKIEYYETKQELDVVLKNCYKDGDSLKCEDDFDGVLNVRNITCKKYLLMKT